MKIAFFGSSVGDGGALLDALSGRDEVGVFVDGERPDGRSFAPSVRIRDLAALHYRNVLFEYDVVVYALGDVLEHGTMRDALCEWPGIVVARGDDLEPLYAREPRLRRAVCERSLGRVVYSPRLAQQLRDDNPWIPVFVVEPPAGLGETRAALDAAIDAAASRRGSGWLRTLLETACAELPGFVPADRSAPWRAELDDLVELTERREPCDASRVK